MIPTKTYSNTNQFSNRNERHEMETTTKIPEIKHSFFPFFFETLTLIYASCLQFYSHYQTFSQPRI